MAPPDEPPGEPPDFAFDPALFEDPLAEPVDVGFASLDLSPFYDPSLDAFAPEPLDSRDDASDFGPELASLDDDSLDDESFDAAPLGPLLR